LIDAIFSNSWSHPLVLRQTLDWTRGRKELSPPESIPHFTVLAFIDVLVPSFSTMAYSYDSIPVGYFDAVFQRRAGVQSKWHHDKFRRIIAEIGKTGRHLDFGCGPGTLIGLLDQEVRSVDSTSLRPNRV
jgi:hypothetical protein